MKGEKIDEYKFFVVVYFHKPMTCSEYYINELAAKIIRTTQ
jgi:hypothetical protein